MGGIFSAVAVFAVQTQEGEYYFLRYELKGGFEKIPDKTNEIKQSLASYCCEFGSE